MKYEKRAKDFCVSLPFTICCYLIKYAGFDPKWNGTIYWTIENFQFKCINIKMYFVCIAQLCNVQCASDTLIKKKKGQNKTKQNVSQKENAEKSIGILTVFRKCDMLTYHLLGRITFWPSRWLKQFILRFYVHLIVVHFIVCMCLIVKAMG